MVHKLDPKWTSLEKTSRKSKRKRVQTRANLVISKTILQILKEYKLQKSASVQSRTSPPKLYSCFFFPSSDGEMQIQFYYTGFIIHLTACVGRSARRPAQSGRRDFIRNDYQMEQRDDRLPYQDNRRGKHHIRIHEHKFRVSG